MTDWTRDDSTELDRIIRAAYPNRRPLRYDPAIAALIIDNTHTPGTKQPRIDTCSDCNRTMWRSRKPKPPGYVRHHGNGLCSTCHFRTRDTQRPRRALRIPSEQATA